MKKSILNILLVLSCIYATSQPNNNIPSVNLVPTAVPESLPNDYDGNALNGNMNFIRKFLVKSPEQNETSINFNSPISKVNCLTVYTDGLGREMQSVSKRYFGSYDFVINKNYDELGKESLSYLPYSSLTNIGKFKANAYSELNQFYNNFNFVGSGNFNNDKIRYTKDIDDGSPLSRPKQQMKPGNSWAGSSIGLITRYETNMINDVRNWEISAGIPVTYSTFNGNTLFKTSVIDEDQNESISFKDNSGLTLLECNLKDLVSSGGPLPVPVYSKTYYIYDELKNLRFVLPPLAVEQLETPAINWSVTQTLLDALCFQYKYDERGRLVEKKIPGKSWEYMIYDNEDRLILTQDGNLRINNQWNFIIFDQLGRIKVTGLYTYAATRIALQGIISALGPTSATNDQYLDYWMTNKTVGNYIYPTSINDAEIYTYTYYDRYPSFVTNVFNTNYLMPVGIPNAEPLLVGMMTRGVITCTRVKILKPVGSNLSDWIEAVNFYDNKSRLIQSQQTNSVGGVDIITMQYDFSNKLMASYSHHTNPTINAPLSSSAMYNTTDIQRRFVYDNQQRPTFSYCTINNLGEMPIAQNQYDPLGRISTKYLGGNTEYQVYTYNLQGQLTGINPDWVKTPTPTWKNYFGEILCYDQGFSNQRLNGNIVGVLWRGADITKGQRSYGYTYDKLNRLTHAEFRENSVVSNVFTPLWKKDVLDFSVSNLSYDANGNIISMDQRGPGTTGPVDMDLLHYTYKEIGGIQTNQLDNVKDYTNVTTNGLNHDFQDGTNNVDDYDYDDNGNQLKDKNKEITSISYTYLNKPSLITFANGNTIQYVYDALGGKLEKITTNTATSEIIITDYVNGHVYDTKSIGGSSTSYLKYILHEEGRIRPFTNAQNQDAYTYDFFVKDHLGNVRATVNAVPTIGLPQIEEYFATMEPEWQPLEESLFDDLGNVICNRPNGSAGNTRAIVLDGDDPNRRIGTSLMIRVMPRDKFSLKTHAYYNSGTLNDPIDPQELITNIVTSLSANNLGNSSIEGLTKAQVIESSFNNSDFMEGYNSLKENNTDYTKPLAYLNYLFFDDRFSLVPELSGAIQVNADNTWHELWTGPIPIDIDRPGYLYTFHSVENSSKVYFDDFNFTYYKGELLEETHYYPYGLTIDNLSYSQVGVDQKYKYNTKELQRGEFLYNELEWYDYGARMQDPQIGRWFCIDNLSEQTFFRTPYAYALNNPISFIDIDGNRDLNTVVIHSKRPIWMPSDYAEIKHAYYEKLISDQKSHWLRLGVDDGFKKYAAMKAQNDVSTYYKDKYVNENVGTVNSFYPIYGSWLKGYLYNSIGEEGWGGLYYSFAAVDAFMIAYGTLGKSGARTISMLDDAAVGTCELTPVIKEAAKKTTNGLSKIVSSQKQLRHLAGTAENAKNGGGFMNSVADAQSVLDAVHSGKATLLGTNKAGFPVYRFNGVTGTNVNAGAGITGQSTNVFIIKGTTSPSVVPTNPFWKP